MKTMPEEKLAKRKKNKEKKMVVSSKTESFVDHAGRISLIFQDGVTRMQKSLVCF